jgi:hypothetical protein
MGDWPNNIVRDGDYGILSPAAPNTPYGQMLAVANNSYSNTSTAWTANRAVYWPVVVNRSTTIIDFAIDVATQNGNVDAGIYDWFGTRIVSNGGVACGAAGAQIISVADTTLSPGWYHIAFSSDSGTAVFRGNNIATPAARACGAQQQASAYPLPSTATFAAYTTGFTQMIVATTRSVF